VLYFKATNADGNYIWKFDGTNPPSPVFTFDDSTCTFGGGGDYNKRGPMAMGGDGESATYSAGGLYFFTCTDDEHGTELWKFDPSENNATVIDINPGVGSSNVETIQELNGVLCFSADDGTEGMPELFRYAP